MCHDFSLVYDILCITNELLRHLERTYECIWDGVKDSGPNAARSIRLIRIQIKQKGAWARACTSGPWEYESCGNFG